MEDKLFWYWLASLNTLTVKEIQKLLKVFLHPKELFYASQEAVRNYIKENQRKADVILAFRDRSSVQKKYNKLIENGIHFITSEEEQFPEKLRHIYDAPYWLFMKGHLPDPEKPAAAIVGARVCSNYGKETARKLAFDLSGAGFTIISGMAAGIDSFAHQGALAAGCATYAVLGTGPDICYPPENINLYMELQKNGGILTEYPPKTAGLSYHFPMRNRIISGLADCVVVVEARIRSGSLITADFALEQGRMIYAVPGRIDDKLSRGCLDLIWQGAVPVRSADDILEDFGISKNNSPIFCSHSTADMPSVYSGHKNENSVKQNIRLETEEKIVYANLSFTPKHIETLLEETKMPAENLLSALTKLELEDKITQPVKNYYAVPGLE